MFKRSYGSGGDDDALYKRAVAVVVRTRRASITNIQRHLRIGYNHGLRFIKRMEHEGIVSAPNRNGVREVLLPPGR